MSDRSSTRSQSLKSESDARSCTLSPCQGVGVIICAIVHEGLANRIGSSVRAERERQGLRQEELALAAGVSTRTVSQIETAKATSRLDVLERVLAALGLSVGVEPAPRSLASQVSPSSAVFTIYRDPQGTYRWRLLSPNGRVAAMSSEGYETRDAALRSARHAASLASSAPIVDRT